MRSRFFHLLIALLTVAAQPLLHAPQALAAGSSPLGEGWTEEDDGGPMPPGALFQFPGMPPVQMTPDGHLVQPPPNAGQAQSAPPHRAPLKPSLSPAEQAKAAKAAALKRAMAPQKTHAQLRTETLDALFKHLGKAADAEEAEDVATAINRIWLQSDSATANLLMTRGLAAMQAQHLPLALTVFDRLLVLQPNWAAAWQKRATTRLLGGDVDGAIADMRQVVKLDPRNFATLAALGLALHREGLDKEALSILRKSLALDPQQPEIKDLVDQLGVEVEGRDI